MDLAHLDWPFFDPLHCTLAERAVRFDCGPLLREGDIDRRCRSLVRALGEAGLLRYCVPEAHGGALPALDSRALCVVREALAYRDGLTDFAFAMQGLGSGAITLAGSDPQRANWLPRIARGEAIAAFALSEPEAGSDAAALSTGALRDRDGWALNGCKSWISNGGIADFYCVFARTGADAGARGISAFLVPAEAPGLSVAERIELIAPHPIARIELRGCRPADSQRHAASQSHRLPCCARRQRRCKCQGRRPSLSHRSTRLSGGAQSGESPGAT